MIFRFSHLVLSARDLVTNLWMLSVLVLFLLHFHFIISDFALLTVGTVKKLVLLQVKFTLAHLLMLI